MNPHIQIEISARLPDREPISIAMRPHSVHEEEAFSSLPRDHDFQFLRDNDRARIEKTRQIRRMVARYFAEELAEKLLEMMEARDPKMGYSPEEWIAMHGGKES